MFFFVFAEQQPLINQRTFDSKTLLPFLSPVKWVPAPGYISLLVLAGKCRRRPWAIQAAGQTPSWQFQAQKKGESPTLPLEALKGNAVGLQTEKTRNWSLLVIDRWWGSEQAFRWGLACSYDTSIRSIISFVCASQNVKGSILSHLCFYCIGAICLCAAEYNTKTHNSISETRCH